MSPDPTPVRCSGFPSPLPDLASGQPSVSDIPATSSLSITLDLSNTPTAMGSKFWPKRGSPGILHHIVRRLQIVSLVLRSAWRNKRWDENPNNL